MTTISASRFHDISVGHTVTGHESKCAHLHGHNYRVHFKIESAEGALPGEVLDGLGRILDFSVIKSLFCEWLEDNWDHHFLVYRDDPRSFGLRKLDSSVVIVPFNPTAENMASYLLEVISPNLLQRSGYDDVRVSSIIIEETYKCSVEVKL